MSDADNPLPYGQFWDLVWDILGQMEEKGEAFGGSMAEGAMDAMRVSYAVAFECVTTYEQFKEKYPGG